MWNKSQIKKLKKYLKSKEYADRIKELNKQWEDDELKERQENIEWWLKVRDNVY